MTLFGVADPDKAHDKKLNGTAINMDVTSAKTSLRRLRDAVDAAATFYGKYAERKRNAQPGGHLPLLLPEMAEWSRHDAFCGSDSSGALLYREASRLAAIEELLNAERAAIGTVAATTLRGGAKKLCEHGLAALYAFELEVQKASQAKDAANKALKKGMAAREAAVADERKAAAIKDDSKRAVAKAAAQRALEKADHEKGEAEDAFARAEQELGRLNREAQPAALRAATDARRQVESGPLMSAAAALAAAYQTFAEGAATALGGGDGAPRGEVKIVNSKMRKAPKEAGTSQFSGHVVQWTLAKRRGKASAALVEEFIKCGLETLLCPAKEGALLAALSSECEDANLVDSLRRVAMSQPEHAAACSTLRTALGSLIPTLGAFRATTKAHVAKAEDYEKKSKALKALKAKRDEAQKAAAQAGGEASGKVAAAKDKLAKLDAETSVATEALEQLGLELEAFATELRAENGERSVMSLVARPVSEAVRAYLAFCATRAGGGANVAAANAAAPPFATTQTPFAAAPPAFGAGNSHASDVYIPPSWTDTPAWSDTPATWDDAPVTRAEAPSAFADIPSAFQPAPAAFAETPAAFADTPAGASFGEPSVGTEGAPDVSDNPFVGIGDPISSGATAQEPSNAGAASAPQADPFASGEAWNLFLGDGKSEPEPALLAGWYSAVDPSTNKTYYCGPGGETSWTPPVAPVATAPPQDMMLATSNPFL